MKSPIAEAKWIWCADDPSDRHVWAYARRALDISSPAGAFIDITADLRYFLWVNGKPLGFGPPKYHSATPTFDRYALDESLRPGRNVIAVLVYSLGTKVALSSCMPKRGGLRAAVAHAGGAVVTDRTWRMRRESAYQRDTPPRGSFQPPAEGFDAQRSLGAPWQPDYDDAAWAPAAELPPATPGEDFERRDIPLFGWRRHEPDRIVETGLAAFPSPLDREHMTTLAGEIRDAARLPAPAEQVAVIPGLGGAAATVTLDASALPPDRGAYAVWDFGRIWTGYPEVTVSGTPGAVLDLSYGEHLTAGHVDPTKHSLNYCDRIILGGERIAHRITWPKCLRYLQADVRGGEAVIHGLGLQRSAYPVRRRGAFACGDPALNQAWDISAHTVELCMEDGYMDTPWRERGSWLGDDLIKWQANALVFGDRHLMRRFLIQHARGQRPDGSMQSNYPGGSVTHVSTYTLRYAVSLLDYVDATGDVELARQLWPVVARTVGWLARWKTPEGLYGNLPVHVDAQINIYNFIDWAPVDTRGCNAAWNAFAYQFLTAAAGLAEIAGDAAARDACTAEAAALRQRFRELFWDDRRGVFVNGRIEGRPLRRWGCHENYLAVLFGLADDAQRAGIIARLRQENLQTCFVPDERDYDLLVPECGKLFGVAIAYSRYRWPDDKMVPLGTAYFAGYALQALCELGLMSEALAFIRDRWGRFSKEGATTVWETWTLSDSLSHGWSCSPVVLFARYVLGVQRAADAKADYGVLPQFGDLDSARGRVCTPRGVLQVAWDAAAPRMDLVVPPGLRVAAGLPAPASARLLVDAGEAAAAERVARYGQTYLVTVLAPGRHLLALEHSGQGLPAVRKEPRNLHRS